MLISRGLKIALVTVGLLFFVLTVTKYILLFNLEFTLSNIDLFSFLNSIIDIIGLVFFILVSIYYHKKKYNLAKYSLLFFLSISFLSGFIFSLNLNVILSLTMERMNRISICLELLYYLSILYSRAKERIWLRLYAISSLIIIIVRTISHYFKILDIAEISSYLLTLAAGLLIIQLITESTKNEAIENNLIDELHNE